MASRDTPLNAPRRVPLPRTWSVRAEDIVAILIANGVFILAMWVWHGGLDQLDTAAGILTGIGQLTALQGTYLALIQLLLMSRSPWLEGVLGMDRLAAAHRWIGFACLWLLLGHILATTVGYALGDHATIVAEAWSLVTTYPYVLMATASLGLFAAVGISSLRRARRRLSYETWYGIHLYAYLAIALGFAHQLVVGSDFLHDALARAYWVGLYLATIGLVLIFRVGQPVMLSLRHRLRVADVVTEAPGVVSIYMSGHALDRLAVRSGQWFVWRFLTRHGWWRAHPYSLSAAPNGAWLRITVKDLGDDSRGLHRLQIGTRIFVEGPYGILTGARRTRPRVLLVAGGIGITPMRALLEALPARRGDLALIYRARRATDLVFRDELDALAERRGAAVHYVIGRRGSPALERDPLDAEALRELVPDVRDRDVYLCGPSAMMQRVESSLRALGLPRSRIHSERFEY
ncbi:MAG: ferredoxin reductase family protein [Candidatus Limnocylindrales bacterium]